MTLIKEVAMASKKRFDIIVEQSTFNTDTKIIIDTETGVQYLYHQDGYGGGMHVLVDKDGKPLLASSRKK